MTSTDFPTRDTADGAALQMLIMAICNSAGWELVEVKPLGDEAKVFRVRCWDGNDTARNLATGREAAGEKAAASHSEAG